MRTILISLKIFLFFTILTGLVYPLLVTGIAQVLFPEKANGSILYRNNLAIGSSLIGQEFDDSIYFSSRPSAISYNPLPSGGSNFALSNAKLKDLVSGRRDKFIKANDLAGSAVIPSEMLFASASGLDPDITPEAALLQVNRVAKARHFTTGQKEELLQKITDLTQQPQFLFLGEERINVLLLNLDLDQIK
jgi:potassium-transporting ATPase KdpC subunit